MQEVCDAAEYESKGLGRCGRTTIRDSGAEYSLNRDDSRHRQFGYTLVFDKLEHIVLESVWPTHSNTAVEAAKSAKDDEGQDGNPKDGEPSSWQVDRQNDTATKMLKVICQAASKAPSVCTGFQSEAAARFFPGSPGSEVASKSHAHIDDQSNSVPLWCETVYCHPPAKVCTDASSKREWYVDRLKTILDKVMEATGGEYLPKISFVDCDTQSPSGFSARDVMESVRKSIPPEQIYKFEVRRPDQRDVCAAYSLENGRRG